MNNMNNQSKSCKTCIHKSNDFWGEECGATGELTKITKAYKKCGAEVNWKYWSPKPENNRRIEFLIWSCVIGIIISYILVFTWIIIYLYSDKNHEETFRINFIFDF